MAAKGGGAWKVAYADFVTAMMAFFLVMWIIAQNNTVRRAIARYFNDPRGLTEKPGSGSPLLPSNRPDEPSGPSILPSPQPGVPGGAESVFQKRTSGVPYDSKRPDKNLKELLADKSSLYVIHNGDRSYAGTMVLFPKDSSQLDAAGKERLIRLLDDLRGKPNKLEIRGHATQHPSAPGAAAENPWKLSYERCQAVKKFLETHGIEPERIRLSQGGPYEPYSLQAGSAKQAYNSRAEIYVLDEYAEDLMGTPEERAKRFVHAERKRKSEAKQ
jgi:chemotaxis protein MotB